MFESWEILWCFFNTLPWTIAHESRSKKHWFTHCLHGHFPWQVMLDSQRVSATKKHSGKWWVRFLGMSGAAGLPFAITRTINGGYPKYQPTSWTSMKIMNLRMFEVHRGNTPETLLLWRRVNQPRFDEHRWACLSKNYCTLFMFANHGELWYNVTWGEYM